MQRTLKRESKVLEIAERKTIATDRCGFRHDPSLVGFRKNQRMGEDRFFFLFSFFFPPFFFFRFQRRAMSRLAGAGPASVRGTADDRRRSGSTASLERRVNRFEKGGGRFFFFFFPSRADRLSGDRFGRLRSRNLRRPQAIVRWTEVKKISQDDVRP